MVGAYVIPACLVLLICGLIFPFATIMTVLTKGSSIPMVVYIFMGVLSLLMLTIGVLVLSLSINHYRASRNKILSLSRGNPLFYYGDINAPIAYDKKDIQEVVQYGGGRSSDRLSRTEIIFKDGSSINVSGMILSSDRMAAKFPHQNISYRLFGLRFFIPRVSATPS